MAHVDGGIVDGFYKDAKLALSIGLNYEDETVKGKNQELAKEYGQYNVPVQLVYTKFSHSGDKGSWQELPATDKAVVMPPGCYLEFDCDYRCNLGYGLKITVQPEGKVVADNWYFVHGQGFQTPKYRAGSVRRFTDGGSTIQLIDWCNYQQYNVPVKTAEQAWLVDFEVWPVYSYTWTKEYAKANNIQGGRTVSVPQAWLEQHYASGIGGQPDKGWQGEARKGHVLRGPSSAQEYKQVFEGHLKERKDLSTKITFMALVVKRGNLSDFKLYDWAQRSSILDD